MPVCGAALAPVDGASERPAGTTPRTPWKTRNDHAMPVFTRRKDDVLVLTADGDYTPGELARVGARAFDDPSLPRPVPLLLDLSGAAGLAGKTDEALGEEGAALSPYRDRVSRLAVVVAGRFATHFAPDGPFADAAGMEIRPHPSHRDAVAWLSAPE